MVGDDYIIKSIVKNILDWSHLVHVYFPWNGFSHCKNAMATYYRRPCWNYMDLLIYQHSDKRHKVNAASVE